jgi:tetratricopeptide (TPR) repeat protein
MYYKNCYAGFLFWQETMEYQEYLNRIQQATQLMSSSRFQDTIDFLYLLLLSDISDIDKASICVKLASVYDRMGNTETAISWYDKGINLEQNYSRFEVLEKKALYLSQLGRSKDSVKIYETLLKQPYITEADRERMRKTIQTFLGQTTRQWM